MNSADGVVVDGDDGDESWIGYKDLDQNRFQGSLTTMALVSSLILQPFNVLTTRQQAGTIITGDCPKVMQHTVAESLVHYRRELGWKGLFRGWLPVACMGVPSQLVYLSITEKTRETFQTSLKKMLPTMNGVAIDTAQSAATALLANAFSLLPFVPAEVISSRMIVQPAKGIGMFNMMSLIYREGRDYGGRTGGIQAFYRGFNISFVYGVVLSTVWWGVYSSARRELQNYPVLKNQPPSALDATAGLAAGLISTCCAHPLDTVKTRIMTGTSLAYLPILSTMRGIIFAEGYRALWKGLPAAAVHGTLSSTGFALSYEIIKRFSANAR